MLAANAAGSGAASPGMPVPFAVCLYSLAAALFSRSYGGCNAIFKLTSVDEAKKYIIEQSDHVPVWVSFQTDADLDDEEDDE